MPNLIGLTLQRAAMVLPAVNGLAQIQVTAEVVSGSVTPETIVAQSPAPGTTAPGAEVTIAVPPSRPCNGAQLTVTYQGGGVGTGNDFGTIVVRNTSAAWCVFAGPVGVVGLDRGGRADTQRVTYPVPTPLTLSPRAPIPTHGQPPALTDIEALVEIAADYRDGPQANGLCDTMQVIPTRWQLTLPIDIVLSAQNDDPTNEPAAFQEFHTCRGQMDNPMPITISGT